MYLHFHTLNFKIGVLTFDQSVTATNKELFYTYFSFINIFYILI